MELSVATKTITLKLTDIVGDKRVEYAKTLGCDPEDVGNVDEVSARELGEMLGHAIIASQDEYLWPGSDLYAQVTRVDATPI